MPSVAFFAGVESLLPSGGPCEWQIRNAARRSGTVSLSA